MLGEELYPLVHNLCPTYAGKVTGMLLEMGQNSVLQLISSPQELKDKVKEAVDMLQAHLVHADAARGVDVGSTRAAGKRDAVESGTDKGDRSPPQLEEAWGDRESAPSQLSSSPDHNAAASLQKQPTGIETTWKTAGSPVLPTSMIPRPQLDIFDAFASQNVDSTAAAPPFGNINTGAKSPDEEPNASLGREEGPRSDKTEEEETEIKSEVQKQDRQVENEQLLKQELGSRLYGCVHQLYPYNSWAYIITSLLLQRLDVDQLTLLLQSREHLVAKAMEAYTLLVQQQQQQQQQQQLALQLQQQQAMQILQQQAMQQQLAQRMQQLQMAQILDQQQRQLLMQADQRMLAYQQAQQQQQQAGLGLQPCPQQPLEKQQDVQSLIQGQAREGLGTDNLWGHGEIGARVSTESSDGTDDDNAREKIKITQQEIAAQLEQLERELKFVEGAQSEKQATKQQLEVEHLLAGQLKGSVPNTQLGLEEANPGLHNINQDIEVQTHKQHPDAQQSPLQFHHQSVQQQYQQMMLLQAAAQFFQQEAGAESLHGDERHDSAHDQQEELPGKIELVFDSRETSKVADAGQLQQLPDPLNAARQLPPSIAHSAQQAQPAKLEESQLRDEKTSEKIDDDWADQAQAQAQAQWSQTDEQLLLVQLAQISQAQQLYWAQVAQQLETEEQRRLPDMVEDDTRDRQREMARWEQLAQMQLLQHSQAVEFEIARQETQQGVEEQQKLAEMFRYDTEMARQREIAQMRLQHNQQALHFQQAVEGTQRELKEILGDETETTRQQEVDQNDALAQILLLQHKQDVELELEVEGTQTTLQKEIAQKEDPAQMRLLQYWQAVQFQRDLEQIQTGQAARGNREKIGDDD